MKLLTSGSWWIYSRSDPRWRVSGHTDSCGGFQMPPECKEALDKLTAELGEPPIDTEHGYMKD